MNDKLYGSFTIYCMDNIRLPPNAWFSGVSPAQEKGPLIAGAPKPAEIESTIDEVEEELEVEGEKWLKQENW